MSTTTARFTSWPCFLVVCAALVATNVDAAPESKAKPRTKAKPKTTVKQPRPLGLRCGLTLAKAEALLLRHEAQQRLRLMRATDPTGHRVEHAKLSARLPKNALGLRKLKLAFSAKRLVRIKLYGEHMVRWVSEQAGKPTRTLAKSRYWLDARRLRGIRCEPRRCEIFDLRPLIGKGLSRKQVEAQYRNIVARSK